MIARFGTLGRVPKSFLLRSDNGLVLTSRSYTVLVRSYGLRQEFITPVSIAKSCGTFASGRYAMLADSMGFSRVPWKPVIEQRHLCPRRSVGSLEFP